MQLLIQRIEVAPYDPRTGNAPTEEGAFTTKIRTGHYRVNIRVHQIPRLAACVNHSGGSSDNSLNWLPDGEAIWLRNIQAFEIAPPLVIRF